MRVVADVTYKTYDSMIEGHLIGETDVPPDEYEVDSVFGHVGMRGMAFLEVVSQSELHRVERWTTTNPRPPSGSCRFSNSSRFTTLGDVFVGVVSLRR